MCVCVCVFGIRVDLKTEGVFVVKYDEAAVSLSCLSSAVPVDRSCPQKLILLFRFVLFFTHNGSHHGLSFILCPHSAELERDHSYYHLAALISEASVRKRCWSYWSV